MVISVLLPNAISVFAEDGDNDVELEVPTEEKDILSGDFEFKIRKDGTAQVTNYTGTDETIEVPSSVEGYTVTAVKKLGLGADFTAKTVICLKPWYPFLIMKKILKVLRLPFIIIRHWKILSFLRKIPLFVLLTAYCFLKT